MNYYRRYVGDYLRDTSRISLLEHGAYTILLDHYYAEELPAPLDLSEIYRMCRATMPEERAAVDRVLAKYFRRRDDGYHNARADREIEVSKKARTNGAKGGRPKTEDETDLETERQTGEITGLLTGEGGGSGHPPTTNHQPPSATRQSTTAARAAPAGFEEAWKALPKRAGNNPKRRAEKAYSARLKEGIKPDAILAGAVRYAKFAAATGKAGSEYVMQGATFFGPERPFEQAWAVAKSTGDWRRSPDAMMAKAKELGISTRGLDSRQLEQEITTRLAA